jgi:hypothetical protein
LGGLDFHQRLRRIKRPQKMCWIQTNLVSEVTAFEKNQVQGGQNVQNLQFYGKVKPLRRVAINTPLRAFIAP